MKRLREGSWYFRFFIWFVAGMLALDVMFSKFSGSTMRIYNEISLALMTFFIIWGLWASTYKPE